MADKPVNRYKDPHWNDDGPVSGLEDQIWEEGWAAHEAWLIKQYKDKSPCEVCEYPKTRLLALHYSHCPRRLVCGNLAAYESQIKGYAKAKAEGDKLAWGMITLIERCESDLIAAELITKKSVLRNMLDRLHEWLKAMGVNKPT